ncbi:hypothetical protein SRB17_52460 [Streptomyces sp. RB17]|uniref:hypothetical protein n=1 Tax=Streptomyces sp. RB17 TaxID=2585197 RepID=UPI0012954976|nr:hypothetical protein [Streptomyces sp. RB17]MQY37242.1 hypothetical protein [Streptomyces sp. RB17]
MNLNDFLIRAAADHGHRRAVELGDHGLTYTELDALAGRTSRSSPHAASPPATGWA